MGCTAVSRLHVQRFVVVSALLCPLISCTRPPPSAVSAPPVPARLPTASAAITAAASVETAPRFAALTKAAAVELMTDGALRNISPADLTAKLRPYFPLRTSRESEGQLDLEGQNGAAAQLVQASFMKSGGRAPPSFLQLKLNFHCSEQSGAACLEDFRHSLTQRLGRPEVLSQDPKSLLWYQQQMEVILTFPEPNEAGSAGDAAHRVSLSVAVPQGEAD